MKIPKIPAGLQAQGKRFWRKVLSEYSFCDAHDLERLKQCCQVLDEIQEAEEIVKDEGRFIKDRFEQKKEHPASKAIRENRVLFCRILRELGIDLTTTESRIQGKY